jgi:hypothetical protein
MLRLLYFSSFLSAWGNRMWEFAVYIHLYPTYHTTLSLRYVMCAREAEALTCGVCCVACGNGQVPILLTSVFTDSLLPASAFPFATQLACVIFGTAAHNIYIYCLYFYIYTHTH